MNYFELAPPGSPAFEEGPNPWQQDEPSGFGGGSTNPWQDELDRASTNPFHQDLYGAQQVPMSYAENIQVVPGYPGAPQDYPGQFRFDMEPYGQESSTDYDLDDDFHKATHREDLHVNLYQPPQRADAFHNTIATSHDRQLHVLSRSLITANRPQVGASLPGGSPPH